MKKKVVIGFIILLELIAVVLLNESAHVSHGIPVVDLQLRNLSFQDMNSESSFGHRLRLYDSRKILDRTISLQGVEDDSWNSNKKSFSISFQKEMAFLGLPEVKQYLFLANAMDPSLLKNDFTFHVAREFGIHYSYTGVYVDLFVDDEYLGNYYVMPDLVIHDDVIPLRDSYALLVELDNVDYNPKKSYRTSTFHDYFSVKDSVNEEYDLEFYVFQNKYEEFEKAVFDKNYDKMQELMDMDSLAMYYILSEFAENPKALKSHLFFYMDGVSDRIHVGPVWSFDGAYGSEDSYSDYTAMPILMNQFQEEGMSSLFYHLLRIPEFQKRVCYLWDNVGRESYRNQIKALDTKISFLMKSGAYNNETYQNGEYQMATGSFHYWLEKRFEFFDGKMEELYQRD